MPKSKLNRDQWLALVAEYAQSGLGVAEFCAAKDVSAQSFYSSFAIVREIQSRSFIGIAMVWPCGTSGLRKVRFSFQLTQAIPKIPLLLQPRYPRET